MLEGERLHAMFQPNVKGTTQFGVSSILIGTITAAADGTASKQHYYLLYNITCRIVLVRDVYIMQVPLTLKD